MSALDRHLQGRPGLLDPTSDDGWLMVDEDVLAELSIPKVAGADGEILVSGHMDGSWKVDRRCTACRVTVVLRNPRYRQFDSFREMLGKLPCFRPWTGPVSLYVEPVVDAGGVVQWGLVEAWSGRGCPAGREPVTGPRPC